MAESRNSADIMTTSTEDDDANKSSAQTPTTQLPSSHETSRKRKRLSAVLDKLATQIERRSLDSSSSEDASPPASAAPAPQGGSTEPADKPRSKMRAPPQKQVSLDSEMSRCVETKLDLLDPPLRRSPTPPPPPEPRERRRRTGGSGDCSAVPFSPNRPGFTPPASSEGGSTPPNPAADDVFSPPRGDRSARPPAPALQPLRIPPEGYPDHLPPPTTPLMGNGATALTLPGFPACDCPHCRTLAGRAPFWEGGSPLLQKVMSGGGPLTPVSPLTPSFDAFLQAKFLPEFYKRRSHSDSDLHQCLAEAALGRHRAPPNEKRHLTARRPEPLRLPQKGGSLESDQDSPLDLSVKSNGSSNPDTNNGSTCGGSSPTRFPLSPLELPDSPVRTASSSPSSFAGATRIDTTTGGATGGANARKNVVEVSNSDVAYACPVCGQMFSLHDRLAKHMASRHRGRHRPSPDTTTSSTTGASKSYTCEVCGRSFARSDMLTRHVRLHTGVKPYTCRACGQVFSRSDHLSTHQRTHTGEKPYRCPQCPYAACRRDMITRHMRTHARCELPDSSSGMLVDERGSPLQHLKLGSPGSVEMAKD